MKRTVAASAKFNETQPVDGAINFALRRAAVFII